MKIKLGEEYEVTVDHIIKCGCVVRMKDNSTQLIHISQISDKFVKDINDFVHIGDKYVATAVQPTGLPLQLSIKHHTTNSRHPEIKSPELASLYDMEADKADDAVDQVVKVKPAARHKHNSISDVKANRREKYERNKKRRKDRYFD